MVRNWQFSTLSTFRQSKVSLVEESFTLDTPTGSYMLERFSIGLMLIKSIYWSCQSDVELCRIKWWRCIVTKMLSDCSLRLTTNARNLSLLHLYLKTQQNKLAWLQFAPHELIRWVVSLQFDRKIIRFNVKLYRFHSECQF